MGDWERHFIEREARRQLDRLRQAESQGKRQTFTEAYSEAYEAAERRAREEAAFRRNYDGPILTQGRSTTPLGDLVTRFFERLGASGGLAYDIGRKFEVLADLTFVNSIKPLEQGDVGGALENLAGGPGVPLAKRAARKAAEALGDTAAKSATQTVTAGTADRTGFLPAQRAEKSALMPFGQAAGPTAGGSPDTPVAAGRTTGGKGPRIARRIPAEERQGADLPQALPGQAGIKAHMPPREATVASSPTTQAGPVITAPSEKWKRLTAMPAEPKPGTAAYSPYSELDGLFRDDPLPPVPQIPIPRYVPPRGVPQRVLDLTADTRVRDGMIEAAERGFSMGVADWYKTQQLKWAFIDEFGKREGSERFDYFMDLVGATSPVSAPWENIRNASYYYTLNNRRLPDVNPYPYGHRFQNMHRRNVMKVWNGGLDPLVNPKPVSFGANLKGNHASVVIDLHNIRLPVMLYGDPRFLNTYLQVSPGVSRNIRKEFAEGRIKPEDLANPTYWTGIPRKNEHGAMERYYQDIARQMGRSPEDVQSAIWIGGGGLTGQRFEPWKTWMDSYKDRLLLTVREKRMDPRDVLKRMLRAELPLLTLGGVAIAPSLMRREMEERPASR